MNISRQHLARAARWLAKACMRAAERIEPTAQHGKPLVLTLDASDDPDGALADRIIGTMQLRHALRRYSPPEERAEA